MIKFEINEERRNVINRNLVSVMRPKRMIKYLAKGVDNNIILVIYYIKKEKYNPVNVINKDKKYLMFKGSNYDDEIRKINIYI